MRKTEIKVGVKIIKEAVMTFRNSIPSVLAPLKELESHFDAIDDIQANNNINIGLDFGEIKHEVIEQLIEDSEDYSIIEAEFDVLLENLEDWASDVSENKANQIRETYIEQLEEIKDNIDISEIQDTDELDDVFADIIYSLDNFEYL